MDKHDKQIMVVPRQNLFSNNHFEGFLPAAAADFESRILSNSKFMIRRLAEQDPSHKQPIGYIIIVNPETGKIFAYRRTSKDSAYSEKRLMGKWSWGLGGHIEMEEQGSDNPIRASMLRELQEEAGVEKIENLKVLGYINDDSDSVGQVHFGILFIAETDSDVKPSSPELELGHMMAIEELEKICSSPEHDVETWSKIALAPLREYLKKSPV